jgi:RHS repeat-associated protein
LTSVTYPGPTTTSYTFDAFGNRLTKTTGANTTNYAYNDGDRLTSVTPPGQSAVNNTWDNNGNMTARGSDSFAWDFEDRMTSATIGGTTTSFGYRGDGLRNSRTVGGNTTTFTWDINAGLPVVIDDGAQYVYGASGLVSQVSGANTYFYLADGLGSTMKTVDTSGTVVNAYEYDVYGKVTASSGAQANDFQFAGQQTDATGLQYLRGRYMDPETGTFLSREPMAVFPGWGGNPFGYGAGNPATMVDPTGTEPTGGSGGSSNSGDWHWVPFLPLPDGTTGYAPDGSWIEGRNAGDGSGPQYRLCGPDDLGVLGCGGAGSASDWAAVLADIAADASRLAAAAAKLVGEYVGTGSNRYKIDQHTAERMVQKDRSITKQMMNDTLKNKNKFRYFHEGECKVGYFNKSTGLFIGAVDRLTNSAYTPHTTTVFRADQSYINGLTKC